MVVGGEGRWSRSLREMVAAVCGLMWVLYKKNANLGSFLNDLNNGKNAVK